MEEPQVIVGQAWGGRWVTFTNDPAKSPRRIELSQAAEEVAKHFNCTPENARESLLKHGYASQPKRDWRVVGRGYDEHQSW